MAAEIRRCFPSTVVLSNEAYDPDEYIRDYDAFVKEVNADA